MAELQLAVDCYPDQKAQKRLNTIHLLVRGTSFELALKHARVFERCLQKWISWFNEGGIDAITYRPIQGRPRVMEKQTVTIEILPEVNGPRQASQHYVTATKLCGWLHDEKGLDLSNRTLVRYLHEHDYARRIPRPFPFPPTPRSGRSSGKSLPTVSCRSWKIRTRKSTSVTSAASRGDPRLSHKWVKRGLRPSFGYYGGHFRTNVIGAVAPRSGQLVSLMVPYSDRFVFQQFLDTRRRTFHARRARRSTLFSTTRAGTRSSRSTGTTLRRSTCLPIARITIRSNCSGSISGATTLPVHHQRARGTRREGRTIDPDPSGKARYSPICLQNTFGIAAHPIGKRSEKFIGIVAIIAFTIWYSRSAGVRSVMKPANTVLMLPVRLYDLILGAVFWVLLSPFRLFFKKAHLPEPIEEVEHALEIIHEAEEREKHLS